MVNHMLLAHNKVKRDFFIYTCLAVSIPDVFICFVLCCAHKQNSAFHCNQESVFVVSGICCFFHDDDFSFASHSIMNCTVIGYTLIFLPLFKSSEINPL